MNKRVWAWASAVTMTAVMIGPGMASATGQQELDWRDCTEHLGYMDRGGLPEDVQWECADLQVPVDYENPDGRTTAVTVSRLPAANGAPRGTVFGNPGGPGVTALDFWLPSTLGQDADMPAELHQDYDLVAVEPRGLTHGGAIDCQGTVADSLDPGRAYRACAESDPEFVASLSTANTARDLDTARQAMGVEQADYLGYSYGTYLGGTYATLYPESTGKMVLDSAVHPDWVWQEEAAQQADASKARTNDMFQWIADNDDTYHLGTTPLQVFDNWERIVNDEPGGGLNLTPPDAQRDDLPEFLHPVDEPVLGAINGTAEARARGMGALRALTGQNNGRATSGVRDATLWALGDRDMWPVIAIRMQDINTYGAYQGEPFYYEDTRPLTTNEVMFTAVTCNENDGVGDPVQAGLAEFNDLTGGNAFDVQAQRARGGVDCAGWPATTEPVQIDGSGLEQQPLVLQSERDPITPFPGGPAMAEALGGHLLTVEGGDHGAFGRGNETVDGAVLDYLATGEVPEIDRAPEAEAAPFGVGGADDDAAVVDEDGEYAGETFDLAARVDYALRTETDPVTATQELVDDAAEELREALG